MENFGRLQLADCSGGGTVHELMRRDVGAPGEMEIAARVARWMLERRERGGNSPAALGRPGGPALSGGRSMVRL